MTFARDLASFADSASQNQSFRNLIINGKMDISQRGTSVASITSGGYRTVDRWRYEITSLGTWTSSQESDAPSASGFGKSFKTLCTTTDASPAAGDLIYVRQAIEGQNLQSVLKGTSSAKQLTLSFWVKSNKTGTYIAELFDGDNTRSCCKSYTVDASGVWEYKTITYPADTTGAFTNDNNSSLELIFWLGAGSTYTSGTLQTTWASTTNANRAVGQTNLGANTNNYWQITGVQLETGPAPTPFEHRFYPVELAMCQRYYERGFFWYEGPANGGGQNVRNIQYTVQKRTGTFPTSYGNVSGGNNNISSHSPESGYDVYDAAYPQSNANTGFDWRFVASTTANCTLRQWWAAEAEL